MENWSIHWADLVIIGLLGFGAFLGAVSGFKMIVTRLIAYVAAAYFTAYAHGPVRDFLATHIDQVHEAVPILLSYVLTFVGTYLVLMLAFWGIKALLFKTGALPDKEKLDEWVTRVGLKPIDRVAGGAVGIVFAFVAVCLLTLGLEYANQSETASPLAGSKIGEATLTLSKDVADSIPQSEYDRLKDCFSDLKGLVKKWLRESTEEGLDSFEDGLKESANLWR